MSYPRSATALAVLVIVLAARVAVGHAAAVPAGRAGPARPLVAASETPSATPTAPAPTPSATASLTAEASATTVATDTATATLTPAATATPSATETPGFGPRAYLPLFRRDLMPTPQPTPFPTPTPSAPAVCPGPLIFRGALAPGDPLQQRRVARDGLPDTCSAWEACTPYGLQSHAYDVYRLRNNAASAQCVTVQANTPCTGPNYIFVVAYRGEFAPQQVCTNWVGDMGVSPDPLGVFGFTAQSGQTYSLVVSEVSAGAGCPDYTLTVSAGCAGPTATPPSQWQLGARLPAGTDAAAFTHDGRTAYLVARDGPLYRYDPVADSWQLESTVPAPMPGTVALYGGGRLYVMGGLGDATSSRYTRIYDLATRSWSFGAALPGPRAFAAGGAYGERLYVVGGRDYFAGGGDDSDQNWVYDIAANSWMTKTAMPIPRGWHSAQVLDGGLYVFGGWSNNRDALEMYRYEFADDVWVPCASLGSAHGAGGGAAAGGRLWAFGGSWAAVTEVYDPRSDRWSYGPPQNVARTYQAGVGLNNVLLSVGGVEAVTYRSSDVTERLYIPPIR